MILETSPPYVLEQLSLPVGRASQTPEFPTPRRGGYVKPMPKFSDEEAGRGEDVRITTLTDRL